MSQLNPGLDLSSNAYTLIGIGPCTVSLINGLNPATIVVADSIPDPTAVGFDLDQNTISRRISVASNVYGKNKTSSTSTVNYIAEVIDGTGTPVSGAAMPPGGSGTLGWLSAIFSSNGTLGSSISSLGTSILNGYTTLSASISSLTSSITGGITITGTPGVTVTNTPHVSVDSLPAINLAANQSVTIGNTSSSPVNTSDTNLLAAIQSLYSALRPYSTIVDTTSTAGYTYICEAVPGTLSSAAAWRIQRIDGSGNVTFAAAAAFSQIADNRANLTYST